MFGLYLQVYFYFAKSPIVAAVRLSRSREKKIVKRKKNMRKNNNKQKRIHNTRRYSLCGAIKTGIFNRMPSRQRL